MTRTRRVGALTAALVLLVALGFAGVAGAIPGESTGSSAAEPSGSSDAPGVSAGSDRTVAADAGGLATSQVRSSASVDRQVVDPIVEQTHVVRLAPAEPGTVYVETTVAFERPEAFARYSINFTESDAYALSATTDFEREGDAWVLEDDVSTAAFTTEIDTSEARYSGSTATSALVVFPLEDWDRFEDASGAALSPERTRTLRTEGTGVVREDAALLGSHRRYTERSDGTVVELLVSEDATMEPDPETVARDLAAASTALAGPRWNVTVLAVPDYLGVPGYAREQSVVVEADDPAASADSTWLHEYVHASEDVDKAPDFWWFTEGYAEYEAALLALEQGHANWEEFRSHLAFDESDATVTTLTDHDTWGSDVENADVYGQGAIALGWIDLRIRTATDGRYALDDVVQRLHDDGRVNTSVFLDRVAEVADRDLAAEAEAYLTTRTVPSTWSASEHESAFRYDPTGERSVDRFHPQTVTVDGTDVRDLDGDGEYMDVNGDGDVSNGDVVDFFGNQHVDPWDSRPDLFDFDGDGDVGQSDVVELFEEL